MILQRVIRLVGVANIAMAVVGLYIIWKFAQSGRFESVMRSNPLAFPVMVTMCVSFLIALIAIGILLVRTTRGSVHLALSIYAAEIVYFAITGGIPGTFSAFAVGNAGLYPQLVTGFPLWAGALVWWCNRSVRRHVTNVGR
jgi:hypothetical protein